MKKVVVASHNPVKLLAARTGFERMFAGEVFEFVSTAVPSGVRDQPMSSEETLRGALNRARAARQFLPDAEFWVGIEGGIEDDGAGEMAAFAWVTVLADGLEGKARTGTFYLPVEVARLIHAGKELGEADDIVFGRTNSKQENGAIGILTGDVIDRAALYEHAVVLALVPFRNPDLYR